MIFIFYIYTILYVIYLLSNAYVAWRRCVSHGRVMMQSCIFGDDACMRVHAHVRRCKPHMLLVLYVVCTHRKFQRLTSCIHCRFLWINGETPKKRAGSVGGVPKFHEICCEIFVVHMNFPSKRVEMFHPEAAHRCLMGVCARNLAADTRGVGYEVGRPDVLPNLAHGDIYEPWAIAQVKRRAGAGGG